MLLAVALQLLTGNAGEEEHAAGFGRRGGFLSTMGSFHLSSGGGNAQGYEEAAVVEVEEEEEGAAGFGRRGGAH